MDDSNAETKTDVRGEFTSKFFAAESPKFTIDFAAVSHRGKIRPSNEDHYAVLRRTRTCDLLLSNMPAQDLQVGDAHAYGILVADGIGGAEFGEFASRLAIETLVQASGLATSWLMKFKDLDGQLIYKRAEAYVDRIQDAFARHARAEPGMKKMGTTLTAAYLVPPHVIIAHIGDSRAYHFRRDEIKQITRDHTLAQTLIDAGARKEEVSRLGNVLVNSLGSGREHVDADVMHFEIQSGDRLLLCSDGLSDLVTPAEMAMVLKKDRLQAACDRLLQLALDAGGRDNITVVICEVDHGRPTG